MFGRIALFVIVCASSAVWAGEQKGDSPPPAKRVRAPREKGAGGRAPRDSPRALVEALGKLRTGRSAVPFTEPGGGDPWPLRIFEKLDRARKPAKQ
jgi:hypothetical protein